VLLSLADRLRITLSLLLSASMLSREELVTERSFVRTSWICRKHMTVLIGDFERAIGEAGLSESMGSVGYDMCNHFSLLRSL
jgi:hypothetical protein